MAIDWTKLEKSRSAGKLKPGTVAGTCVVCNGNLYIGESGLYIARHQCPTRVIAGREAADRAAADGNDYRDPMRDTLYGNKLKDGFAAMHGGEDVY